jgi:hypothetical protein
VCERLERNRKMDVHIHLSEKEIESVRNPRGLIVYESLNL